MKMSKVVQNSIMAVHSKTPKPWQRFTIFFQKSQYLIHKAEIFWMHLRRSTLCLPMKKAYLEIVQYSTMKMENHLVPLKVCNIKANILCSQLTKWYKNKLTQHSVNYL
jgi:hypothetical protein